MSTGAVAMRDPVTIPSVFPRFRRCRATWARGPNRAASETASSNVESVDPSSTMTTSPSSEWSSKVFLNAANNAGMFSASLNAGTITAKPGASLTLSLIRPPGAVFS